jgi:hypothetical protein
MQFDRSNPQTPEQWAAEIRRRTCQLERLNLTLRRHLELAELLVPKLNVMIDQLGSVQFADNLMFSAGIVYTCPYEPRKGPADSAQTFQAVLKVPGGIGALILDTEELLLLEQECPGNMRLPRSHFEPFEKCPDAVKATIFPKIPELLTRLSAALAIGQS